VTPAKISLNPNGSGSIIVGGIDIANAASAVTIEAHPSRGTTAAVRMDLVEALDIDADLRVDDRTRDALLALGWTEPADTDTQWGYSYVDSPTAIVGPVSELRARRTVDGDYSAVLHRRDLIDGTPGPWKAVETR